jgi:chemotaxis methyl-accepting protein methylase
MNLSGQFIDDVGEIVRRASGLSFPPARRWSLGMRIEERLQALNLERTDQYLGLLRHEGGELTELLELVTTHKTSFFRQPG